MISIRFTNRITGKVILTVESNRERFTHRDYDNVKNILFEYASGSKYLRLLTADVYYCSLEEVKNIPLHVFGVLHFTMVAKVFSSSSIMCHFSVARKPNSIPSYPYQRLMCIAD